MADANVNNGIGVVWGISTGNLGTGTAYLMLTEEDFHKIRANEQHYDKVDGSVIAETYYRKESTLRIRLYPAGTTNANARTANQNTYEPGQELLLVDIDDPEIAGYWSITEVGKQRRWADKVYSDLGLRRWGNNVSGSGPNRISQVLP